MKKSLLTLLLLATLASSATFAACENDESPAGGEPSVEEPIGGEEGDDQDQGGDQGGEEEGDQDQGGDRDDEEDGDQGSEEKPLLKIEGIEFAGTGVYTYDGAEKIMKVNESELPAGISVSYTGNKATAAGSYEAVATLFGEGYETATVRKSWTIAKANITWISAEENQALYVDGENHLPQYTGDISGKDLTAKWYLNDEEDTTGVKERGTYAYTLSVTGENYEELRLNVTLKLKKQFGDLAKKVVDAFGTVPQPWGFLPDTFNVEQKVLSATEVASFATQGNAYATFVDVSSVPTNYIGKQLNVVYGVLNKTQTALGYVNTVHKTLSTVQNLYQTFLNGDPDNYEEFSAEAGGLSFCLVLEGDKYYLSTSVGTVGVKLFADESNEEKPVYGARIQLTDTTVLKYTVAEGGLKIAVVVLGTAATQVEFVRQDGAVTGYVYECLTVAGKTVSTSALLTVGEKYLTVVGTKGDFLPAANGRNCEVYSVATGKLVGTEVRETMKCTGIGGERECNTLWFNLRDLQGVSTIKKADEANYPNADTVYINGASEAIHTKIVGIKDLSRRFDIEFKKVCAYKKVTDAEGNVSYEEVEFEVPMLFVQEEQLADFETDFYDKNKDYLTSSGVKLKTSAEDRAAVHSGYYVLVDAYDKIKAAVTIEDIKTYCEILDEE